MAVIKQVDQTVGGQTQQDRLKEQWQLHQLARLRALQGPLYVVYFLHRLWLLSGNGNWAAWLFLAAEFGFSLPWIIQWQDQRSLYTLGQTSKPRRVVGEDVPYIDILLPCAGEPVDVISDTVRAACVSDYPINKFRVIVLDDATSDETKEAIHLLKTQYRNLHYTAHPSDSTLFSKAANLNSGLRFADELQGGPGEYVAGLDIDMIPEPVWLRALLPQLLEDKHVGAVGTPQCFYNIPRDDPLRQYAFWALYKFVQLPNLDLLRRCVLSGSGWLVRRKALDSVGQFCESSTTEDIFLSLMLIMNNWKTGAVIEPLQYGILPDTMSDYLRQKRRWAVGSFETMILLNRQLTGMPWANRMLEQLPMVILTMSRFLPYLSSLSIIVVIYSQQCLVPVTGSIQFNTTLLLSLLQYTGFIVQGTWQAIICHRKIYSLDTLSELWLGPQEWAALIMYYLPGIFRRGKLLGVATGVVIDKVNERNTGRITSAKHILFHNGAWMQLTYLGVCGAVVIATVRSSLPLISQSWESSAYSMKFVGQMTTIAFPPLLFHLYHSVTLALIPVTYALTTPSKIPSRNELLDRDQKTMVAYPKAATRDSPDKRSLVGLESAIAAGVFAFIIGPSLTYFLL